MTWGRAGAVEPGSVVEDTGLLGFLTGSLDPIQPEALHGRFLGRHASEICVIR